MNSELGPFPGASEVHRAPEVPGTLGSAPDEPSSSNPALSNPVPSNPAPSNPALGGPEAGALPIMPGFREMALRRADEQAARMAEDRGRLVRELAEQRQAAGLSQTEVAARMGTSQSAVARLQSGTADIR